MGTVDCTVYEEGGLYCTWGGWTVLYMRRVDCTVHEEGALNV